MNQSSLHKLIPLFLDKIWGGSCFSTWYALPSSRSIGEVWCASTLPDHTSLLSGTDLNLRELLRANPTRFPLPDGELPFRITLIDAAQPLSVQIHPDQAYAHRMGLESGLSEAWVILKSTDHAELVLGHNARSQSELLHWVDHHAWDRLLNRVPSVEGQFVYIPGATLHALGAGNLIYEISERPDITYRLYDYDRVDANTGLPRELHRQEAMALIVAPESYRPSLTPIPDTSRNPTVVLERPEKFGLALVRSAAHVSLPTWGFLTIVEGEGTLSSMPVTQGDTILVDQQSLQCTCSGKWQGLFAYLPEGK
jgi:mannose-6-phosphate isomerase